MSASVPVLSVEGLRKLYGQREVVAGVSFRVLPGEIIGLLGSNGAGKTTTFKMVTGMVPPNAGRISLKGEEELVQQSQSATTRLLVGSIACALIGVGLLVAGLVQQ